MAVPEAEHQEVLDAVLRLAVLAEAEVQQPTQTMQPPVWPMLRFRLVLFADPAARSRTRVPGPQKPDKTSLDSLPGAGTARCGSRQARRLRPLRQAEELAVVAVEAELELAAVGAEAHLEARVLAELPGLPELCPRHRLLRFRTDSIQLGRR